MSLKVECPAVENLSFEPAVPPAAVPAVFTPRDRIENAKQEERSFAGRRNLVTQYLFEKFEAVPPSGAITFELKGKAQLGGGLGGQLKVSAERSPDGDYTVRVQERGSATIGAEVVALEANLGGALTYWVRTPEAAADLVSTLAEAQADPGGRAVAVARSAWYAADKLSRAEVTMALDLHLSGVKALGYVGGEVSEQGTVAFDFHRRQIIVAQGVAGEFADRLSAGLGRAGSEYELSLMLRTTTTLPPDVFDRVVSGELSWRGVIQQSVSTHQLVLEGEKHGELVTANGGVAQVSKLHAELDLNALARDPLHPAQSLRGEIEVHTSVEASGCGIDLVGNSLHLRSATYTVTKQGLFDEADPLQSQLEAQRLAAPR